MESYINDIKKAVRYATGNLKIILILGFIVLTNSIVFKNEHISLSLWRTINVFMFFLVGYGSYVVWNTINGSDKLPDFENPKKLFWEGFKKSVIIFIYSIPMTYLVHLIHIDNHILISLISLILFVTVHLMMIGGLLNRYLHRGKFTKAFNISQIIALISMFDLKFIVKIFAPSIVSQLFIVSIIISFDRGFSFFELSYSIAAFFMAPVFFLAAKRLVGFEMRNFLEKNNL